MNIVIIDDNDADSFLIEEQLKTNFPCANVTYFRYLNDFLQSNTRYDFVVTDLGLPDAYGPDVIQRIRQVTGKPIIVLSGVGGADMPISISRTIHNSGATIFLSKSHQGIEKLPDALRQFI